MGILLVVGRVWCTLKMCSWQVLLTGFKGDKESLNKKSVALYAKYGRVQTGFCNS
jgi:hypothetical protein